MLGYRGESDGDLAGGRVADGGYPVEVPDFGGPAQGAGDVVDVGDQVGLVLGLAQHTPPGPGVGQGADEQVRVRPGTPGRGWVGQFDPVPLGLLPGRDDRPALEAHARRDAGDRHLGHQAGPAAAQLAPGPQGR